MAGSNQYTQLSASIIIVRGISDKVRRICVGQVVLQAVLNARWLLESKYVATFSRKIRASCKIRVSGLSMQEAGWIGAASETQYYYY